MVEIASDRLLFKTILVEMAYSVIHLHNRVNKSRIVVLLLCPEELESDSCGFDRINQVLYRQEGSRTFRDFPRGLRDLLQNVAQICTMYIFRAKCEVRWKDNTLVTSRFGKKCWTLDVFH
jgi:hypothetical protein